LSIDALRQLNTMGYGKGNSALQLDLVYNPLGPSLPGPQEGLERDYKKRLGEDFGVTFERLITITNMPIGRFRTDIESAGKFDLYMDKLRDNFNPTTVQSLMCRTHL